jgi:hypothetical protein
MRFGLAPALQVCHCELLTNLSGAVAEQQTPFGHLLHRHSPPPTSLMSPCVSAVDASAAAYSSVLRVFIRAAGCGWMVRHHQTDAPELLCGCRAVVNGNLQAGQLRMYLAA